MIEKKILMVQEEKGVLAVNKNEFNVLPSLYISIRFRPFSFAIYKALSACLTNSSGDVNTSLDNVETPKLKLTTPNGNDFECGIFLF